MEGTENVVFLYGKQARLITQGTLKGEHTSDHGRHLTHELGHKKKIRSLFVLASAKYSQQMSLSIKTIA